MPGSGVFSTGTLSKSEEGSLRRFGFSADIYTVNIEQPEGLHIGHGQVTGIVA